MKTHFTLWIYILVLLLPIGVAAQDKLKIKDPGGNVLMEVRPEGVLVRKVTTIERLAVAGLTAAENGLMVYDTDTKSIWLWRDTQWNEVDGVDLVDDADSDPTNELDSWLTLPGIPPGFSDGTDDVNDADSDPTNELQSWMTLPGIPAGFADGTDNVNDADSDPTNELQSWNTLPGVPADFADGMDNVNDADSDPTNELQTWNTLPGVPADFADGTDNVNDADSDPLNEKNNSLSRNGTQIEITDAGGMLSTNIGWAIAASTVFNNTDNVGIGTSTPAAKLNVQGGAVLFSGTTGATPVSGAGTRMMWVPEKQAFRVGIVGSSQWDALNIGPRSFVGGGTDNIASGYNSIVAGGGLGSATADGAFVGGGYTNTASGINSFVGSGDYNVASGNNSYVSGGSTNTASESASFVGGGISNTASGGTSFVGGGFSNSAIGYASFVSGRENTASASHSFAAGGTNNVASGDNSAVTGGLLNTASGYASFASGRENTASESHSFAAGGINNIASGVNSVVAGGNLGSAIASGAFVGGGSSNTASGVRSFIGGGMLGTATADNSFVGGGFDNNASGNDAFVGGGNSNNATGGTSFIAGGLLNTASGYASFAAGRESTASGNHSFAGGTGLLAKSFGETVFGSYNTDYTPTSALGHIDTDRLFVIGKGTGSGARSNAMTILKGGNVGMGTDVPQAGLHVVGDKGLGQHIMLIENTNHEGSGLKIKIAGSHPMWVQGAGENPDFFITRPVSAIETIFEDVGGDIRDYLLSDQGFTLANLDLTSIGSGSGLVEDLGLTDFLAGGLCKGVSNLVDFTNKTILQPLYLPDLPLELIPPNIPNIPNIPGFTLIPNPATVDIPLVGEVGFPTGFINSPLSGFNSTIGSVNVTIGTLNGTLEDGYDEILSNLSTLDHKLIPLPQLVMPESLGSVDCPNPNPWDNFDIAFERLNPLDYNILNPISNDNHFITFVDSYDNKLGAITGQSIAEFNQDYFKLEKVIEIGSYVVGLFSVDGSIVKNVMKLGKEALSFYKAANKVGVEYSSGHGDYAEWLERADHAETIGFGDIVGIRGGKVSLSTEGAEQVMVVSKAPIVRGNIPDPENELNGNNIAFIGQVPVKVMGPVTTGDYIIANPETPGYGIAIAENAITSDLLALAVGRSWETNTTLGFKFVNAIVGMHNSGWAAPVTKLQQRIESNEAAIQMLTARLDNLENGSSVAQANKRSKL